MSHPTSPRDNEYPLADDDEDWAVSSGVGAGADDFGAWDDDGPSFRMNQSASRKRDRAQAAHIAPRGAELAVREFVMPDLPPSKYERDEDSEQHRAVFRVLDQALAKGETVNRKDVAKRAGVNENTVRVARPLWDDRKFNATKGRKKAAAKTIEMPVVTPDMLTDALTTR